MCKLYNLFRPVMQSLIDDYCEKARARWMNYINRTFKEKNRAKVIYNIYKIRKFKMLH